MTPPGARRIWETARATYRVVSWLPNRIADGLAHHLALRLGCRDLPPGTGHDVLAAFAAHFGAEPGRVRLVGLSDRALRLLERVHGRVLAVTWASTIYLRTEALVWAADGSVSDRESIDTLAHELWHVHQFRRSGGGLVWVARWLWERLRYEAGEMPIEVEAREMAREFAALRL